MHFLICLLKSFNRCFSLWEVFLLSSISLQISTSFFEISSLNSSVFFVAAASFSFLDRFRIFIKSFCIHVALRTGCVVLDLLAVRLIRLRVAFGTDCLVLDLMSISSPTSTSPLGRTAIEPVTSSVNMRCFGRSSPASLVSAPAFVFFACAAAFFSLFFFASASVVSAVFFFGLFQVCICGFSLLFDLFFDLLVFFSNSDFFVRLFSDVLLSCSELVFVCYMEIIFLVY